jgi:RimJ/RimL family protein N-acetyltransferase
MKDRGALRRKRRKSFTQLETPRLILRKFRASDVDAFAKYRSDPDVARFQGWAADRPIDEAAYSRREAKDFIDKQTRTRPGIPGSWFQFAIELKSEKVLAGDCALKVDRLEPRIAEIGYTLASDHQGQGIASEAVRAMINYAFQRLSVRRIIAITDCRNVRSIALLERLGFMREGRMRQSIWCRGEWADEFLFGLLRDDPEAPNARPDQTEQAISVMVTENTTR